MRTTRDIIGAALAAAGAAALLIAPSAAGGATGPSVRIIVGERAPLTTDAEALVERLDGTVTRQLPLVGGFAAVIPRAAVAPISAAPSIVGVWPDARIRPSGARTRTDDDDDIPLSEYDPLPPNEVWPAAIGLPEARGRYDGTGVTVAVVDTGVYRAPDLENAVRARLDFTPGHDGIDRFGHGTHMSGIVVGDGSASDGRWAGVAPGARLVSLKVAGPDGATDVSVVLAAIQWVVSHKDEYGIRVINLSYGTDSQQSVLVDPLERGVQRAWEAGVLVVAAVGNAGPGKVDKPGDDPYVVTVGAADLNGTAGRSDDTVAPFSGHGPTQDGVAKPNLVAPGITIVSSRVPDSTVDRFRPAARLGDIYFKGTGTSQATAIVAGVAALLFDANPDLTPDQAKAALVRSPRGLRGAVGAGAGLVDAARAVDAVLDPSFLRRVKPQRHRSSTGLGSIDSTRGSSKPYTDLNGDDQPEQVSGLIDALGNPWDAERWTSEPWTPASWPSSPWAPLVAPFPGWVIDPWEGPTWPGLVWESDAWSSKSWSDSNWTSKNWSSKSWSTWN